MPSSSFRATLPVKPSVTTTSAAPARRSRLSALPLEASVARRQQLVRLERQLVPLLRLLADREQAHLGRGDAEDLLGEDGAHVRELEQMLGTRVGVRAASSSTDGPRARGIGTAIAGRQTPGRRRRWSRPGGEHGAGVSGGDDRVGPPLGDGAARGDERAVRLGADRLRRLLVHRDHLASRRRARARPCRAPAGRRGSARTRPARLERSGDDLAGAAVAAQRVDRDADHGTCYGAGARSGSTSRPRYVLQLGQTRCGRFGWWQCGQSFTRGAAMPCVARRLSRRDFDVFFFGTAMAAAQSSSRQRFSFSSAARRGSASASSCVGRRRAGARTRRTGPRSPAGTGSCPAARARRRRAPTRGRAGRRPACASRARRSPFADESGRSSTASPRHRARPVQAHARRAYSAGRGARVSAGSPRDGQ